MDRDRRTLLTTLALLTLDLGCSSDPAPEAPRVQPTPETHELEHKMFALVNRDRAANGRSALTYDEALADVARGHAQDMHLNHFFAHESPTNGSLDDRLTRARVSAVIARENLAEAPTVEVAQDNLMKSPGHFANLVAEDIKSVGIGVVAGGIDHGEFLVFVQVFAHVVVQEEPAVAKRIIIEKITKARAANGGSAPKIDPILDELAAKYVTELDDKVEPSALQPIGKRVLDDVAKSAISDVSVLVSGQRVIAASEYTPTSSVLDKPNLVMGVGVARARDDGGHPALKVLVLVKS